MRSNPIGVSEELVGAEAVDAGAGAVEEIEAAFSSEVSRGSSISLLTALGIAYFLERVVRKVGMHTVRQNIIISTIHCTVTKIKAPC